MDKICNVGERLKRKYAWKIYERFVNLIHDLINVIILFELYIEIYYQSRSLALEFNSFLVLVKWFLDFMLYLPKNTVDFVFLLSSSLTIMSSTFDFILIILLKRGFYSC
jgi:hypothetical protein